MAKQFDWLSMVPQVHKDCVIGFVRDVQKMMPLTSAYYNIPSLVTYLILEYFYQRESFDIHGKRIRLDDEKLAARLIEINEDNWSSNSFFGTVDIDFDGLYIYEWTIKIVKRDAQMAIGIIASEKLSGDAKVDDIANVDFTYQSHDDFVAYHHCCIHGKSQFEIGWDRWSHKANGVRWEEGDIIKMKINTKNESIEYFKNNESVGILSNNDEEIFNISKSHRLAIMMSGSAGTVQILNFDQKNVR